MNIANPSHARLITNITTREIMSDANRKFNRLAAMQLVCDLLIAGKTLEEICASGIDNVPTRSGTIREWISGDDEESKHLAMMYTRAREMAGDRAVERLPGYYEERVRYWLGQGWEPRDAINAARQELDAEKWRLVKTLPKKYGEKITQEHTGEGGGPLVIEVVAFTPPKMLPGGD